MERFNRIFIVILAASFFESIIMEATPGGEAASKFITEFIERLKGDGDYAIKALTDLLPSLQSSEPRDIKLNISQQYALAYVAFDAMTHDNEIVTNFLVSTLRANHEFDGGYDRLFVWIRDGKTHYVSPDLEFTYNNASFNVVHDMLGSGSLFSGKGRVALFLGLLEGSLAKGNSEFATKMLDRGFDLLGDGKWIGDPGFSVYLRSAAKNVLVPLFGASLKDLEVPSELDNHSRLSDIFINAIKERIAAGNKEEALNLIGVLREGFAQRDCQTCTYSFDTEFAPGVAQELREKVQNLYPEIQKSLERKAQKEAEYEKKWDVQYQKAKLENEAAAREAAAAAAAKKTQEEELEASLSRGRDEREHRIEDLAVDSDFGYGHDW